MFTCKFPFTVLARVNRPGWLTWEVFQSGRGGLHEGVALLCIPLILRGGWLKGNSVQSHGGGLLERAAYTSEYGKLASVIKIILLYDIFI